MRAETAEDADGFVAALTVAEPRGGALLSRDTHGEAWSLSRVPFLLDGHVGTMMMDTGAGVTAIVESFVRLAGRPIRPHAGKRWIRVATGERVESPGLVDISFMVQLMLDVGDSTYVHWDRRIELNGVWVLPDAVVSHATRSLSPAPVQLFVSYQDWRLPGADEPMSPLASLADMVMHGARVIAEPRAVAAGSVGSRAPMRWSLATDNPPRLHAQRLKAP